MRINQSQASSYQLANHKVMISAHSHQFKPSNWFQFELREAELHANTSREQVFLKLKKQFLSKKFLFKQCVLLIYLGCQIAHLLDMS